MESSIEMKNIKPDLRYSLLRTSLEKFEKNPNELSVDNLKAVLTQVEKEHQIQAKILSSDEARGIILTDEAVDRTYQEISARYENQEDFAQDLSKNNLNEQQLKSSLLRELQVETVLERVTSRSAEVTDVDVMIYYHMHMKQMKKPETRKSRHILVTVNEEIADNNRDATYQRISEILEKLRKKPKKFADYAMKYSECPTALKGGELGNVTQGLLYPELDKVLFKLGEKQLSPIVESPMGFHILYCDEIQKPEMLSIAEATPSIRNLLEERRKKICQQTWLSKILAGENND